MMGIGKTGVTADRYKNAWIGFASVKRITLRGKTGVTVDRDQIEFRLFNSSSIFNITLREELLSSPKQNQTMHSCPGFMALVT